MKKFSLSLFLILFPFIALAQDSSMSFNPPPGDYSVVFLSNIFGVVDGILHGTGSQIMGSIFSVFNAAVLALGGIIIMYTLLVSTMNTAHEGQMLGQKWSSIWIPIRSTVGLALLIPKASGYCLMQVFVMWIVVQGVGAADKVWNAALNYLNRGGVVIQAQQNPTTSLTAATSSGVSGGAQTILAGQVCMIGLQKQLETQYQNYMTQKQNNSGPCSGTPARNMVDFCGSMVPDFVNTVSIAAVQDANPSATSFSVTMPNFDSDSPYFSLNGICGTIGWNAYSPQGLSNLKQSLTQGDIDTATMSRAIAIQQMYMDLSTIAHIMVSNDPAFNTSVQNQTTNFSTIAEQQFGIPLTPSGDVCTTTTPPHQCTSWGGVNGGTGASLFNGTEFQGAIADYNGIMLPTLTLVQEAQNADSANKSRAFIQQATTEGWIMAGSYFFNIVNLNQQATKHGGLTDTDTGLGSSTFDINQLSQAFGGNSQCTGHYAILCQWLNQDASKVTPITALINGQGSSYGTVPTPTLVGSQQAVVKGALSSTVYGYTNNSTILHLPGQPGQQPLIFANFINISVDTSPYQLPAMNFGCQGFLCIGSVFADIFYNVIFRSIFNFFLGLFQEIINKVLMTFLMVPIQGMALIFNQGLSIITQPGVNPIVALANMGTFYINFAASLWITLIELSIASVLIPVFGIFIFALISLVMPLLLAWVGIMVSVGFSTAYYVPILPYMIFTFGSIAWLMAVIEAMVAAPIVALGVTHPEGHDAFGKGEQAIMILMNVFLRPSMMIIGFIAAISLSYVGVWVLNAGFDNAIGFVQGSKQFGTLGAAAASGTNQNMGASSGFNAGAATLAGGGSDSQAQSAARSATAGQKGPVTNEGSALANIWDPVSTPAGNISGGYSGWAGIYAYFFSILVYTSIYLTIVQKAFTLIVTLPDKVLRWIGGQPESVGQEAAQWGEDTKKQVSDAGDKTSQAQAAMDKQLTGYAEKAGSSLKKSASESGGGDVSAKGAE